MQQQYPVNLDVRDRPCLVVGGGSVAARKAAGLASCGAQVTVVAPVTDAAIDQLDGVRVLHRPYRRGEAAGYRLVITATGDEAVDAQVFADGDAAGVWVNAADDPDHCSFTLPAILRRGPVQVAVSTGGTSPALASWLRDRLSEVLAPELADVAREVARTRAEIHARGLSTEGMDWYEIIGSAAARHGIEVV